MARLSVVVAVYEVEPYLRECLESIAAQTFADLEAIVVDDGSTDGGGAIADELAARDRRFRVLRRANGGLGAARNAGIDAAGGELLAFVDGDDALPRDAYERLVGALDRSGSDFAAGNVRRLSAAGTRQAPFLRRAFARTRLRTHVMRRPELIVDRIVPNKVWRRSFWDAHGLRFPEGVVHEDIPVAVPAHFLARSVDVLAAPVYLYRVRDGATRSITQRRTELPVLLDRLAAVESVRGFLAERAPAGLAIYDRSIVAEDLRYYLDVLDAADDAYRRTFLERVNALLDGVDDGVYGPLPAIERLKWHLVRRRLLDELLEVLRFQREELRGRAPVRVGARFYGDYPFRGDPSLGVPDELYRVALPWRRHVPAPLRALARRALRRA